MPFKEFQLFMEEINKTKTCYNNRRDQMLYCSCESVNDKGWPRISMLVGDAKRKYELHLNGRDYLMKYKKGRSY
jgi:hypothetical protein